MKLPKIRHNTLIMKFETESIGSHWWFDIFGDNVNESIVDEILARMRTFEDLYSRFIKTSLIYQLNKKKVLTDFPPELFAMFSYCQSISELTDFRFNVCSGIIQNSNGYDESYSFNEKVATSNEAIRNGIISLTKEKIVIRDEVTVDLGGIGKGWLIDAIKLILLNRNLLYFSINGGGDIYATSDFGKPITFFIENPFEISEYIGTIDLKDSAFACSSPVKRAWTTTKGSTFHHLVNAATGEVSNEIAAVFTCGPTALAVDTASTCIFISPKNKIEDIAKALDVEFLTVYPDHSSIQSKEFPGKLVTQI